MTKKQIFYIGIFASITILSSGFKPLSSKFFPWFHVFQKEEVFYTVPTETELNQTFFDIPFTGKTFVGFQQALAVRESQGRYYYGKYIGLFRKVSIWCRNLTGFRN